MHPHQMSPTTPSHKTFIVIRRCPPEDVGGVISYYEFLEAVREPRYPEHRRMLEWYGGPYNPDDIDLPLIRRRIGLLANRRAAGQAAYAKSRRKG